MNKKYKLNSKLFHRKDLKLVKRAEEFQDPRQPPLTIGNVVMLNSGGPKSMVVDITPDTVTVAWTNDGEVHEHEFPIQCVHRVPMV
jgi:uncharacterized protein YodC (DUF2158 family)